MGDSAIGAALHSIDKNINLTTDRPGGNLLDTKQFSTKFAKDCFK